MPHAIDVVMRVPSSVVAALVLIVGWPALAAGSHHQARRPTRHPLSLSERQVRFGGSLAHEKSAELIALTLHPPAPLPVVEQPTFVAVHSLRVQRDILYFGPEIPLGDLPMVPNESQLRTQAGPSAFTYVQTPPCADLLQIMRERDQLRLFEPPPQTGAGLSEGIGMFTAATMMVAHLPRPLRFVVDDRVHLGPTIFSDGGMGAGVGGHWM